MVMVWRYLHPDIGLPYDDRWVGTPHLDVSHGMSRSSGEGRNSVTVAQFSQYWIATFSLDPAVCRDIVLYLRALGDMLVDEPTSHAEFAAPLATYAALAAAWFVVWSRLRDPFLRRQPAPIAAPVPMLSRPR
jgi:hypothetical protein